MHPKRFYRKLLKPLPEMRRYRKLLGIWGLLCAIAARAFRSTVLCRIERRDCIHPLWLRIPSSDVPTYEQIFYHHDYASSVGRPPKVIIDAGANIGLASIYFANRFPDATVVAIEPERGNYELLVKNTALYRQVVPVRAALWDKDEDLVIVDPGLGYWGFQTESQTITDDAPARARPTVAGMTLDRLMKDHDLERIDVLKVDIEGAEKEVFSDTSLWIDKVDAIIIELHDWLRPGCSESFRQGCAGRFDRRWIQGENVYVSRGDALARP